MTRTKTRALANWPNNAVSVLDFGAVGDGVTDDRAAIQACIDATDSGTIIFPKGTYKVTRTTQTGSSIILGTTGSSADSPDYVALVLNQKKNLKLVGEGATVVLNGGGCVFLGLLLEEVHFSGLRFVNNDDHFNPAFVFPYSGYEPSAIQLNYSVNCSITNCYTKGQHRGFDFRRTNGCRANDNFIEDNYYLGVSSYGYLYQPPDWTFTPLETYFDIPSLLDSGISISGNVVSQFGYMGIYIRSDGVVTNNRISNPVSITFDSGIVLQGYVGITSSGSRTTITSNSISTEVTSEMLTGTHRYTGISSKLEDVSDGSQSTSVIISNNNIHGCYSGINATELRDSVISGNTIDNYTQTGIGVTGNFSLGSNITNNVISNNIIGSINPNTTCPNDLYSSSAGIGASVTGSNYLLTHNTIEGNVFDRHWEDIVDADAKERQKGVLIWNAFSDATYKGNQGTIIRNNTYNLGDGEVILVANQTPYDASINNVLEITDGLSPVTDYTVGDSVVLYTNSAGDKTLNLPGRNQGTYPGSRMVIINRTASTLTLAVPSGTTVSGQGNRTLVNGVLELVLITVGISGSTQNWEIVSSVDYSAVYSITVEEQKLRDVSTNEEQGN